LGITWQIKTDITAMLLKENKNYSLRVRFALGFGALFTVFLAGALIFIYIMFAKFRKNEFNTRLHDRGQAFYKMVIEEDGIDNQQLHLLEKDLLSTGISPHIRVMIFSDTAVLYSPSNNKQSLYDPALFAEVREKKRVLAEKGNEEILASYKEFKGRHYYVVTAGYDQYGKSKLVFLKWLMIAVYVSGLLIGWVVIYFFVKKAIRPLSGLKDNLNNITHNNLHIRLPETGQGEEVNSLSANFNQMLSRLEQSFSFQRDFVHYASHELRTPLTAMVSMTESALDNKTNNDQSVEIFNQLLNQQKRLTDITNSLLLISDQKVSANGQGYPMVRLDEVIFRSVDLIKDLFPDADIAVNIEGNPSSESSLQIHANEPLMLMAFNNLLKNALQYSPDRRVKVVVGVNDNHKEIKFINSGNNFSREDKSKMFTPFYRGSNATRVKGHGLGLPLVKQIIQLHEASINYSYESDSNVFTVSFT
jgi:signal transduction histidine kinase